MHISAQTFLRLKLKLCRKIHAHESQTRLQRRTSTHMIASLAPPPVSPTEEYDSDEEDEEELERQRQVKARLAKVAKLEITDSSGKPGRHRASQTTHAPCLVDEFWLTALNVCVQPYTLREGFGAAPLQVIRVENE